MQLTIGRKLALGFGLVVTVLVTMSGFTYFQLSNIVREQNVVVEKDIPTQALALKLRGRIHAALSAHRGYMILGLPSLKTERAAIWDDIHADLEQLTELTQSVNDTQAAAMVEALRGVLVAFSDRQERIVSVAHTPANKPADLAYSEKAAPFAATMQEHLAAILAAEDQLEASNQRRNLAVLVGRAETHLLRVAAALSHYLNTGQDVELAAVENELNTCSASVARLKSQANLLTPEQSADFEAYLSARDSFIAEARTVIATRSGPEWNVAEFVCATGVTPLANEADRIISGIVEHAE